MFDSPLIAAADAPIPVNGRGIVFLRDDGVPCVRLSDGTVKSMKGEDGQQGPQGPQGPSGGGGGGFKGTQTTAYILAQDPAAGINDLYRVIDGNAGVQLVFSDGTQWINFMGGALYEGEQ